MNWIGTCNAVGSPISFFVDSELSWAEIFLKTFGLNTSGAIELELEIVELDLVLDDIDEVDLLLIISNFSFSSNSTVENLIESSSGEWRIFWRVNSSKKKKIRWNVFLFSGKKKKNFI